MDLNLRSPGVLILTHAHLEKPLAGSGVCCFSQDGKVRTDMFYPAGFMDVVQIEKTKELSTGFRAVSTF